MEAPECFGKAHSEKAKECSVCILAPQCSILTAIHTQPKRQILDPTNDLEATTTFDGGFLSGTASHLAYRLILSAKEFEFEGLFITYKRLLLDKGARITRPKMTLEKVIYKMLERGDLKQVGHRRYKVV